MEICRILAARRTASASCRFGGRVDDNGAYSMTINRMGTSGRLMLLFAMTLLAAGCKARQSDPLGLTATKWKSLSVQYCVGEGSTVVMKSWSTSDEALLDQLQHLGVQEVSPLSLIGTMTTNRLDIVLATGETIRMYVLDEHMLTMHDPARKKKSYSLRLDGDFVKRLRSMIDDQAHDSIHFYYDHEVSVAESLPDGQ